jgi:diguanylate cyclase (GGDEF)-like protein
MGGDEFIVLLLDLSGEAECAEILSRLIRLVNEPLRVLRGTEARIGVSIGYTIFPEDAGTPLELIDHADKALYVVKRTGKNSCQRYQP